MARFLLAVWSLESHVNPNLAVASALRTAGHEVAFYAGPQAALAIAAQGFPIFPFEALREDLAAVHFAALLEDQGSARKLSQHFAEILVAQITPQVDDLNRIIRDWKPDVLVTDMAMVAPFAILHELAKVPVAVLSHVGYCMLPGPDGPIPGRVLPPRRSGLLRLRAWAIQSAANFLTRQVPIAVDAARQRFGLPPTGLRVTQWHARTGLLLIPSIPELDYNRASLPASVRYIGAVTWPAVSDAPLDPQTVLVEEGGYYRKEPFLIRQAITALSDSAYRVKLAPGRTRDRSTFGTLPANISFTDTDVPEAAVVVTTGNTESILRALSRGAPLVITPSLLDQTEMALRIQLLGAGEYLPEKKCSPAGLREAVHRVATDPGYRRKAAEAATLLSVRKGPLEAVRLLEDFARP